MARMETSADISRFKTRLDACQGNGWDDQRQLAYFSAAIAIADENLLSEAIGLAQDRKVGRGLIYEVILQSYLFVGFPRMLSAASLLHQHWPSHENTQTQTSPVTPKEAQAWFDNGLTLCQKVYGNAFGPLREKVESVAPEIFRWMIIEGYGKVLSREGLPIGDRELCIMAILLVENRPEQLHSHLRGAIRTGVDPSLVETVIEDIGPVSGSGYEIARELIRENGAGQ